MLVVVFDALQKAMVRQPRSYVIGSWMINDYPCFAQGDVMGSRSTAG